MSTRKIVSTRSGDCRDLFVRISADPLLQPGLIAPSDSRLEVVGVLNPAFLETSSGRYLIVRVDERPSAAAPAEQLGAILVPYLSTENGPRVGVCSVQVPNSFDPSREPLLPTINDVVRGTGATPPLLLTYMSHLRVVRLEQGTPVVAQSPLAFPDCQHALYGYEDPRVVNLGHVCFLIYTGVGRCGATSWLARLQADDGLAIRQPTMLFGPDHKHTVLFPKTVGDCYYALTRPLARTFLSSNSIWLFESPDLVHWGKPSLLFHSRPGMWDAVRIGPATPPIRTGRGWLLFYYGVDSDESYHVGVALLDLADPRHVLGRSARPVLSPSTVWERVGRRADTVFACGVEERQNGTVRLYYGAADRCVGAADASLSELLGVAAGDEVSE